MTDDKPNYPRLSDLPPQHREPFSRWLDGQTCPLLEDGSVGYYPWDYERWVRGLPILD